MLRRSRRLVWWVLSGLLVAMIVGNVAQASACGIDGIPSMNLNGRLVTINADQATKQNLAYWAPFVLAAAKPTATLRFGEDESELHKSLSSQAFAVPFQWSFGDGVTAKGLSVTHRYSQPGWYKVNVSYYYTPEKRWVVFDSAQLLVGAISAKADAAVLSIPLVMSLAGGILCLALLAFLGLRFRAKGAQTAGGGRPDKRKPTTPAGRAARDRNR
jgi:hypothetical protein